MSIKINKMKTFSKRKRAISTILTTVIILVASVVLGSGVVLYGTSLFQSSTLTEQLTVSGAKVWIDPDDANGLAWGAAGLRNSGDKSIPVNKISVRGIDIPFTSWFATTVQTEATVGNTQAAYTHVGAYDGLTGLMDDSVGAATTGNCNPLDAVDQIVIDVDAGGSAVPMCLERLTGPISLDIGDRAVVYFQVLNGTLNPIDAGISTSVNIFAGKIGAPLSLTIQKP